MVIYYTHAKRRLSVEGGKDITIDQARTAYEAGEVEDSNIAFLRLVDYGWDMEAVEQSYRSENL